VTLARHGRAPSLRAEPFVGPSPRRLVAFVVVMVSCLFAHRAEAESSRARTIVLESVVGERSANMTATLAPLIDALEGYGFAARPATIQSVLGPRVARPGVLDQGKTTADIAQQIEAGLSAFSSGRFQESEDALTIAVKLIKRNPGLWVLSGSNANLTFNAVVKLALAQGKNGHVPESFETMMDYLRMSNIPISRLDYGRDGEKLYKGAQKQAQPMGRGTLLINVSDNRAVVFVEGQFRGIGKVAQGDLIPGLRHMFVQVGPDARQYVVEIRPDSETTVDIDWQVDSSLTLGESYAGVAFANEIERAKEGIYARGVARACGCEKIIMVGTIRLDGHLEVIGTVYPVNGAAPWSATVPVSEGERGLRSLARFLYDGTSRGDLNVRSNAPGARAPKQMQRPHLSVSSTIVLGAGVAAVGGGIGTYVLSKDDDHTMPTFNDHKGPAVDVVIASSPVLATGIYLSLRDTTSASRLASAALGLGATSLVLGSFLFFTDQDGAARLEPDKYVREYYRDSATSGLVIGAAGVALTGVGAWLWYRGGDRKSNATTLTAASEHGRTLGSLVPAVSVGPALRLLSVSGSF